MEWPLHIVSLFATNDKIVLVALTLSANFFRHISRIKNIISKSKNDTKMSSVSGSVKNLYNGNNNNSNRKFTVDN